MDSELFGLITCSLFPFIVFLGYLYIDHFPELLEGEKDQSRIEQIKKRSMNELRQVKEYKHPKPSKQHKSFKAQVEELRKQYPNDQEFGGEVAKLLRGLI